MRPAPALIIRANPPAARERVFFVPFFAKIVPFFGYLLRE